ncbi:histidine kinase dimerization/phospho-acceptor domain-containing protein [Leptospira sp. WS92.C1]
MELKIKTKLLLGFSAILLTLVIASLFAIDKLAESNKRLLNLVNVSSKRVSLSNEIFVFILESTRHEKNIILEKNNSKRVYYKERIYAATDAADKKIADLAPLLEEEERVILNEIKSAWGDFRKDLDQLVGFALNGQTEKAFKISIEKGLKMRDANFKRFVQLSAKNEAKMEADKLKNDRDYNLALSLLIALMISSLVASLIIFYWISYGIARRISFIAIEAEKIASREFTGKRLEDKTDDELKPIFNSLISINESFREVTESANGVAEGNYQIDLIPRSEKDILGTALKRMTNSLRISTEENEKYNWLVTGQNRLNEKLRGEQKYTELSDNIITFLCTYLGASIGAMYLYNDLDRSLRLSGKYAFSSTNHGIDRFAFNEGLIGQAAYDQKLISINDIPEQDIRVISSVLDSKPKHLLIVPFSLEGETLGVFEIGKLMPFTQTEIQFLNSSTESIAICVNSALSRKKIQELLEETQVQSEELQSQQEELRQMNEELEEQTQYLKQQQEELRMTNEELEEQARSLETKNKEVELARYDIEQKTKQLEISSKYKSEFLANMSHELRTPLNSLLILSKDLSDNKKKNLNTDQIESANIIYKSGQDLLILINDVLDLSKIESGKMRINIERVSLKEFAEDLMRDFGHQAQQKNLQLKATIDSDMSEYIRTDYQRLNQILKNLLSNAIKFTQQGKVELNIRLYGKDNAIFW